MFSRLESCSADLFLMDRQLYDLCQMFPESAGESVKFVLRDAMHEMERTIEAKGRAAFPGLDVVSWAWSPQAQACGRQEPEAVHVTRPAPRVTWRIVGLLTVN